MKITCDVIRDLLPLYAEDMESQDTKELVEEHFLTCPACQEAAQRMKQLVPAEEYRDVEPLSNLKKQINRRRMMTAWFAMLVTACIVFGLCAYLAGPVYLTAEEAGIKVYTVAQTRFFLDTNSLQFTSAEPLDELDVLIVEIGSRVRKYGMGYWRESDMGAEEECVTFIAADTRWNTLFNIEEGPPRYLILSLDTKNVYYSNPGGGADILLWGTGTNAGTEFLPRLVLGYYLLIAAVLGAVLTACAIALRKKKAGRIVAIPGCYLLCFAVADLLITGGNWQIFDAQDVPVQLTLMLILAALMSGAIFCGWEVWKLHKQDNM